MTTLQLFVGPLRRELAPADLRPADAVWALVRVEQGAHLNAKTMERNLRRKYWWWTLAEMCKEYVDNCIHCQRHKSRAQLPMGKLAEIEEPSSMGIGYSVDFLTRLPEQTAARHTAVMVVRDRWSRRVFAIPCRDTTTAKEAALLFYNEICLNQCKRT